MNGEIIAASIISTIGFIIILELNNRNWFKKENFRVQSDLIKKENRLKLKKLERELGLKQSKTKTTEDKEPSILDRIVKGMDSEQLAALAENFLGEGALDSGTDNVGDMIASFAAENPEIVKGFIEGIGQKKTEGTTDNSKY